MFKDGDFKRDRPILSAIQSLEDCKPVLELPEAYVDADGSIRYRMAEPKSLRELALIKAESYQKKANLRASVLSDHASAKPGWLAPQGIMCKDFVHWRDCEAPATIKDSKLDIRIKRKKINFNFNN